MVFSAIINSRKRFALYLEDKIGAPSEQIIIITTMVSVIPFSFLNYLIKGHTNRLLYAFIIGILFHISIYGINSLHSIISTLVTSTWCYGWISFTILFKLATHTFSVL